LDLVTVNYCLYASSSLFLTICYSKDFLYNFVFPYTSEVYVTLSPPLYMGDTSPFLFSCSFVSVSEVSIKTMLSYSFHSNCNRTCICSSSIPVSFPVWNWRSLVAHSCYTQVSL